jgi:hypothetical protein
MISLRTLFDRLCLGYCADRHRIVWPERRRAPIPTDPNDLQYSARTKRTYRVTTETEDQTTAHVWTPVTTENDRERVGHLTPADRQELSDRGLDAARAAKVKELWATGSTNNQIAKALEGQRGYSARNIASYSAAFSAAIGRNTVQTNVNN